MCVFKQTPDSKSSTLYPEDIIGYTVDNRDFYESHSYRKKRGKEARGFFRILIQGRIDLLKFDGDRYFVKTELNELYEVTKKTSNVDGKVKTDYYGLGILKTLLNDCPEITEKLLNEEFKGKPDFLFLIRKYYSCTGAPFVESTNIPIASERTAGIRCGLVNQSVSLGEYLYEARFNTMNIISIGAVVSIFYPKINQNVRVVVEPNFSMSEHYAHFIKNQVNHNDVFASFSYLRIPVILRHSYSNFLFDIGLQTQSLLAQKIRWREESSAAGIVTVNENKVTPLSRSACGAVGGVGYRINVSRLSLISSVRYSYTKNFTASLLPVFQTIDLNLTVLFNKQSRK
jgi:hypothetical protein